MGFGRASEMCLSGRLYAAAEAYEKGLVDRLVPADEVVEQAVALGRARLLRECWETPEHKEAVRAFLEKRPPVFR
jgi:enoyl-CoA hydratase/carnithine racemase